MIKKLTGLQPGVLSITRIVMGFIAFSFGTAKIFHFHAGEFMPAFGSPEWVAGLIELTVGLCFLIGVFTRLSAFILSGLMAAAYFTAHLPVSFSPRKTAVTPPPVGVLFFFTLLLRAAAQQVSTLCCLNSQTAN
ncbi:DoxX family protein [Rhizobium sp. CRRU65]|uniref:DoxX family protein n=1 Tax=Rhizobium sp. CRRU65 TaxID=3399566 RepID=UPI003AF68391